MMETFKFSAKIFPVNAITIIALCLLSGCQGQQLHKQSKIALGTFIEITSSDERAGRIAFQEIERIENLLSKYRPDSDVWLVNKYGKAKVSQETIFVVNKARQFWQASNGAFDITVEPLMKIWGFQDKQYRIPPREEIEGALKLVGMDKVIVDEKGSRIELVIQGMAIDLGGIAKGYAVDRAVLKLREAGVRDALINAGGDIFCLGKKFSRAWQIAIKDPRGKGIVKDLILTDKAIATSGDYEVFFIVDEQRFSHIIDPKTGYPSQSGVVSVSIVADDCLTADALATSIFILGREKGRHLARRFNSDLASIVVQ